MDPDQASSSKFRAGTSSSASKKKERAKTRRKLTKRNSDKKKKNKVGEPIPNPSEITESSSDDQFMKHSPTRSSETDDNEENEAVNKLRQLALLMEHARRRNNETDEIDEKEVANKLRTLLMKHSPTRSSETDDKEDNEENEAVNKLRLLSKQLKTLQALQALQAQLMEHTRRWNNETDENDENEVDNKLRALLMEHSPTQSNETDENEENEVVNKLRRRAQLMEHARRRNNESNENEENEASNKLRDLLMEHSPTQRNETDENDENEPADKLQRLYKQLRKLQALLMEHARRRNNETDENDENEVDNKLRALLMEHSPTRSNETNENEENEGANKLRRLSKQLRKLLAVLKKKVKEGEKEKKKFVELTPYLALYKATLNGDWKTARRILENDPNAMTAKIASGSRTILHMAVCTKHIQFVEELIDFMPAEFLAQTDSDGITALSQAATVGNTKAAKMLVKKNPDLVLIRTNKQETPLHLAAEYGHKETVRYFLSVTREKDPSTFTGESGIMLLAYLIMADFYDIALDLLKHYPRLALNQDKDNDTAFMILAHKPQSFSSGSQLGYLQCIIYHCIPVEMDNVLPKPIEGGDVENPTESSQKSTCRRFLQQIYTAFGTLCRNVHVMVWIAIRKLVPSINHIHDAKLMHKQTLELVKRMCAEVTLCGANASWDYLGTPLFTAARLGIHEFVKEIIKTNPHSLSLVNEDGHNVFQIAVLHRHEKIFSLIYEMSSQKHFVAIAVDKSLNNLLQLAGKLEPSSRVSGAALQMQRELQWFKEIENFVQPSFKEKKNNEKKTPRMVFTEEHEKLVKQGEKWMKTTASSCTVVAALIATVVFAAAFTVPGGNDNDKGTPIFLREISFMVFAISDALSLFSSSTSLLMFLGILTSRFSEEDFFMSLPRKLIIGLITLFISIASMVIAFSATLYIVLVYRFNWVVIPIASFACLPVTLFAFLQFPLLVEIFLSTYGPSIFHQHSKDIIF